jgi:hypothetical protein
VSQTVAAMAAKRLLRLYQGHAAEPDPLQRFPWDAEIKTEEEMLRNCTRSEATYALLEALRPLVLHPDDEKQRQDISRAWTFLESLHEPLPLHKSSHKPLSESELLPNDLDGLIGELRGLQEARRRRAMSTILAYGATAVPALEAALTSTSSSLVQARIIHLLAMLGEVQQIGAVWDAYQGAITKEVSRILEGSLLRMGQTLESKPERLPLSEYLSILITSKTAMPDLCDCLVRGLTRLAQTHPTLELRAALPHLQSSWLAPASLDRREARKAIEQVTKHLSELPVPADAPVTTENLPMPARPSTDSASLPPPVPGRGKPSE